MMEFHEIANVFPLLDGAEFEDLCADVRKHGLREAIVTYQDKILDGRNRARACKQTGTKARYVAFNGDDAAAYAWSLNGVRRHLTPAQRAVVALKLLEPLKEAAQVRQRSVLKTGTEPPLAPRGADGRATEQAAKVVGVGARTVERAAYVQKHAPDLLPKLESGEVTANEAVTIVKARQRAAPATTDSVRRKEARDREETQERAEGIFLMRAVTAKELAEAGFGGEKVSSDHVQAATEAAEAWNALAVTLKQRSEENA